MRGMELVCESILPKIDSKKPLSASDTRNTPDCHSPTPKTKIQTQTTNPIFTQNFHPKYSLEITNHHNKNIHQTTSSKTRYSGTKKEHKGGVVKGVVVGSQQYLHSGINGVRSDQHLKLVSHKGAASSLECGGTKEELGGLTEDCGSPPVEYTIPNTQRIIKNNATQNVNNVKDGILTKNTSHITPQCSGHLPNTLNTINTKGSPCEFE